jgi:hypothetical protein
MLRSVPLFPRVDGASILLASKEDRVWEAPGEVIFEIERAENDGKFDEIPPELGDKVRLKGIGALSGMDLIVASLDQKVAQLFSPLFGGARVTAKTARLTRAA